MARLRYNGLTATLGGSGLTTSATAVTFGAALTYNGAAATPVPTISGSDYIPLTILDSSGNVSEIVSLTAYTSGATTGTISRAQEGTTGVAHSVGDRVANALTVADVNPTQCRAYPAANISLANATVTTLALDGESFDTASMHSTTTNNSRVTIQTDGNYLVVASVKHLAPSGQIQTRLHKNGAQFLITVSQGSSASESPQVVDILPLVAGDYLEIAAYQASGNAQSIVGGSDQTYLTVKRLL